VIVIDASAALEVVLQTSAAASVSARLFRPRETLHAPHLIDLEIAQILRRHALAHRSQAARCEVALGDWQAFAVRRYPHGALLPRVWELRANLTAYDAAYVALAEALAAPLITRDTRLAGAAGHRATIELV